MADLPGLCANTTFRLDEMTFVDFTWLVATWLDAEVLRRPWGRRRLPFFAKP
jgi:hypothetical protein